MINKTLHIKLKIELQELKTGDMLWKGKLFLLNMGTS